MTKRRRRPHSRGTGARRTRRVIRNWPKNDNSNIVVVDAVTAALLLRYLSCISTRVPTRSTPTAEWKSRITHLLEIGFFPRYQWIHATWRKRARAGVNTVSGNVRQGGVTLFLVFSFWFSKNHTDVWSREDRCLSKAPPA